jgi:hypothetical protein
VTKITPVFLFDSKEKWFPVGVEESLEPFGYVWDKHTKNWTKEDATVTRLDLPASMKQPDLPPVGYYRKIQRSNVYWHQFWFWYLYNPKQYAGEGAHEGDWEFVQIGATDAHCEFPVLVTASQHHIGEKREYWRCVQTTGPHVYVARDSHANYLTKVSDIEDTANGEGIVLSSQVEWRDFGSWSGWPGRWGNSTGVGKSPESPACQKMRWNTPQIFHGQAR